MRYLPTLLLPMLLLSACSNPTNELIPPPPPKYVFASGYVCTLSGTTTTTPSGGTASSVDEPPTPFMLTTATGQIDSTTSPLTFTGHVDNDGSQFGTYILSYDPDPMTGALFTLDHDTLAADYDYWSVDSGGTLVDTHLTGTCSPIP